MIRAGICCAVLCTSVLAIAWADNLAPNEDAASHGAILQLSNKEPLLRIPIAWETLKTKPDVVAIEVTAVENPGSAPVTLEVYFQSDVEEWHVGNYTLYPPDRPGIFKARITSIVAQLATIARIEASPIFLCIKLRKPSEAAGHDPGKAILALTIAAPRFSGAGTRN